MTVSGARKALRALEADGLVTTMKSKGGVGRTSTYYLNPRKIGARAVAKGAAAQMAAEASVNPSPPGCVDAVNTAPLGRKHIPSGSQKLHDAVDGGGCASEREESENPAPNDERDQIIDAVLSAAKIDVTRDHRRAENFADFKAIPIIARWRDTGLPDDEIIAVIASIAKS